MAFVSVEDPNIKNSPLTGIFSVHQVEPAPEGYIGEIPDDDPRIETFHAEQEVRFEQGRKTNATDIDAIAKLVSEKLAAKGN